MRRRRFNLRERIALFLAAGGQCEQCGAALEPSWHADHIKPWSKAGETDVNNGQASCPRCNLNKRDKEMMTFEKLRWWQKRFVQKFRTCSEPTFLLVALPGGGKTIAALYAGNEWRRNVGARSRYLVAVVPSRSLKKQWKKKAKEEFGLELQTKEFDGEFKAGMHGCVITYSAIVSEALLFRRLCARHEIMVVFDEVHHVGESAAWGEGIRRAFEGAVVRLAMSGTPWRSDGGQIPFLAVNHETGEYVYQERFDWPEALMETDPITRQPRPAIRDLSFAPYHGFAEYAQDGRTIRLDSRETLSDEDVARCLRGRLFEERFATDVLRAAHAKLLGLRGSKPDAAGIIVCVDIVHALRVAQWLEGVTGEVPVIAVSDDAEATPGDPIEAFGADGATAKWIVSVRQVSEGVDIPRLIVGVYLTNYTTELFFRQFIGRIARNQGTESDREAYVYYPHHPRLNTYAENIQRLQAIAIERRNNGTDEIPSDGNGTRPPTSLEYLGGSDAEAAGLILPGLGTDPACGPDVARSISDFARRYRIPETTAALIMRDQGQLGTADRPQQPGVDGRTNERPLEDRLDAERKKQHTRIGYWVILVGGDHRALTNEANKHIGCASIEVATEEQLKRRRDFIEQKIRDAKRAA